MTFASLFAGIGGFDCALERLGHRCVYANDHDKYCKIIYDKHFSLPLDRRDIRTVAADELPDFDLLCFGFPCQAFSVAGKRRGFEDTRGTLFFEVARIIAAKRPAYLLLENVKGLLNHQAGATFGVILRTLDELGYDAQWQVVNSAWFVPQNRERVYLVGHRRDLPRPEVFPLPDGDQGAASPGTGEIASTLTASYADQNKRGSHIVTSIEPTIISRGFEGRMTVWQGICTALRNFGSGGNKMPMVVQGAALRGREEGVALELRTDGLANALRSAEGSGSKPLVAAGTVKMLARSQRNEWREMTVAGALPTRHRGPSSKQFQMLSDSMTVRRLTPLECERLQGFPDSWTEYGQTSIQYNIIGNIWGQLNVVSAVDKQLSEKKRTALNIIRDGNDGAMQISLSRSTVPIKESAVLDIVSDVLAHESSVCGTINPGSGMVMLCKPSKTLPIDSITNERRISEKMAEKSTYPLWSLCLEEKLTKERLSTISILISEIIDQRIFICAKTGRPITTAIIHSSLPGPNSSRRGLSDSRKANTSLTLKISHKVKVSDTQRYKMLGNAVSVPVVYAVASRLPIFPVDSDKVSGVQGS